MKRIDNIIIQDHTTKEYLIAQSKLSAGKFNGAYFYSKEIVESFIPNINTTYNWQTINHQTAPEHCIVFVHSNNALERYDYLLKYNDVILVCSTHNSLNQLKRKGHKKVIYVPLSIDTDYLDNFKNDNEKNGTIATGNQWAFTNETKKFFIKNNIKHYHDIPREQLLTLMSNAETIYAIGRTAMEAIYLGANVIQPDKEYPVEKYTTYYKQEDAIRILQQEIDKYDKQELIVVGIATMNSRKKTLDQVINRLKEQTLPPDKIFIYNNDENDFNATDNGKFYGLTKLDEDCIFLSIDDDILYPITYIEDMVKAVKYHNCIVTHHGRKLKATNVPYYTGHQSYACLHNNTYEGPIDVAGTGVTAFRTSYFNPKNIFYSDYKRMSDIVFSLEAAKENKQIVLLKHNTYYLQDICDDTKNSCFAKESKDQTNQIKLCNEIFTLNRRK